MSSLTAFLQCISIFCANYGSRDHTKKTKKKNFLITMPKHEKAQKHCHTRNIGQSCHRASMTVRGKCSHNELHDCQQWNNVINLQSSVLTSHQPKHRILKENANSQPVTLRRVQMGKSKMSSRDGVRIMCVRVCILTLQ